MNEETTTEELKKMLENIFDELRSRKEELIIAYRVDKDNTTLLHYALDSFGNRVINGIIEGRL